MGSQSHRENILNPQFTEIGIGIAYGHYKGRDTTYVVQMLARPVQTASTRVVVQPKTPVPVTPTKPLLPTPVPTKTAATTSVLVRPAPKPAVQDTLRPVLKAVASSTPTTTLAEVPSIIADRCLDFALRAHQSLGCRGVSRSDFRSHFRSFAFPYGFPFGAYVG